jgi:nucleotide-binding universal stress UspA family protein
MKILIGYDGSECADAAIGDLRRAGLPAKAEVQILSVAEVWLPPPDPNQSQSSSDDAASVSSLIAPMYAKARRAVQKAEAVANRGSDRLSALFPGWSVLANATSGSPAWEIVFAADNWKPDLVVVGSQGQNALGRLVLGSVSQVVLNEAQCSVRIARGRIEQPDEPVRLLIGLDGSPESESVVREVASRSWPTTSQIKLAVVDDPAGMPFFGNDIPAVVEDETEADHAWGEKILADNAVILRALPQIEVITELIEGNPKNELVRAAEEWGADCIFVGSSGSSNRSARFILGSVSAAVATRAHCSVEVIRKKQPHPPSIVEA